MEATGSLDDNNFGAISHESGAFAADVLSSMHRGHILEPAMPLPVGSRPCFCRRFISSSIHQGPATFTPRWTPPVNTTLSPHPLGFLELAVGPSRPPVATAYDAVYLACPDGHFYGQGARQPLTQGLSSVGLASPPI